MSAFLMTAFRSDIIAGLKDRDERGDLTGFTSPRHPYLEAQQNSFSTLPSRFNGLIIGANDLRYFAK
tara:strand:+ start:2469 stop:2669 length:201 start_codon:yes stop_codon:yes gene_type:complete